MWTSDPDIPRLPHARVVGEPAHSWALKSGVAPVGLVLDVAQHEGRAHPGRETSDLLPQKEVVGADGEVVVTAVGEDLGGDLTASPAPLPLREVDKGAADVGVGRALVADRAPARRGERSGEAVDDEVEADRARCKRRVGARVWVTPAA